MKTILLLHGAIGSSSQLEELQSLLSADHKVYTLDFSGHGGKPLGAPFSIELFSNEVLAFMDEHNIGKPSIFGYSMGGYVAAYIAYKHPEKLSSIVTLATKFEWNPDIAEKEVKMLDAEKIQAKLRAFAETLAKRHAPTDWKDVLTETIAMMRRLGADNPLKPGDYTAINIPSLIMLGDRDKMVSLDETLAVYRSLPAAQLAILPNTAHPIEQADADMIAMHIRKFIS